MPTRCAAAAAIQIEQLLAEADALRARLKAPRRLHVDGTCGASILADVERNEISFPAGPGCTIGLAIRLF